MGLGVGSGRGGRRAGAGAPLSSDGRRRFRSSKLTAIARILPSPSVRINSGAGGATAIGKHLRLLGMQ